MLYQIVFYQSLLHIIFYPNLANETVYTNIIKNFVVHVPTLYILQQPDFYNIQ